MTKQLLAGLVIALQFLSCSTNDDSNLSNNIPPSDSTNKILPLGASRVEGARPVFESYRYELWKDLTTGGFTFDFIGTKMDESSYPDAQFDLDHEGRGGWTSGQIRSGLSGWLSQTGAPDIVLFSSPGGNDALQNLSYDNAIANINAIIDILQNANPNVTIIIERLAPAKTEAMTPQLTAYFNQMQQDIVTIASSQTTNSSQVITVDMFTGFNDSLLADDVHYNEAGAAFIAERYYNILSTILQ